MALQTFLLGSLVVGGGLAGGALISRALLKRFSLVPLDDEIEITEDVYSPWEDIDVDLAMPTQLDFPQGWHTYDEGADGNNYWGMRWRVLQLKAPASNGQSFVTVVSAHAPDYAKDGWGTAADYVAAVEQINVFRRQAEAAASRFES